jgi:hypothetical protein
MGYLTFDEIVKADDREAEEMYIEEWGGNVRLLEMSAKESEDFLAEVAEAQKTPGHVLSYRTKLVALSIVNENNERIFSDEKLDALASKSGEVLNRICLRCSEINGFTEKAVEALTEDLPATGDGDSSSDSVSS